MVENFTSVILENGLVPIASSVQKRLRLHPGDQVSISIKVLAHLGQEQNSKTRYDQLLTEKDERVLTPQEQAELVALANAEFDDAIHLARKLVQKDHPELFDERGQLKKRQALASLHPRTERRKAHVGRKRKTLTAKRR
ncbi:hypothetical protein L0337_21570 [candidate division KSB1 bacterium]|nr:hypothetical protein [candidate division KSB1 bacterium]